MNLLIDKHRDDLLACCRRFHVSRLELFGSATGPGFDPAISDLDFLVEFLALPPEERADSYFGLLEALQGLFDRPVDLVETSAIRNPYFQATVDETRTLLYAA